jgi:hypothetical protein
MQVLRKMDAKLAADGIENMLESRKVRARQRFCSASNTHPLTCTNPLRKHSGTSSQRNSVSSTKSLQYTTMLGVNASG